MGYLDRDYWKQDNSKDSIKNSLNNIMNKIKTRKNISPYNDLPRQPTRTLYDDIDENGNFKIEE